MEATHRAAMLPTITLPGMNSYALKTARVFPKTAAVFSKTAVVFSKTAAVFSKAPNCLQIQAFSCINIHGMYKYANAGYRQAGVTFTFSTGRRPLGVTSGATSGATSTLKMATDYQRVKCQV